MIEAKLNLIAGEWVAGTEAFRNVNPSDLGDVIGEYARADRRQVEDAIAAARAALPSWRSGSIAERAEILHRAAVEMAARADELGTLLAREEGKTRREGIGEAKRAADIFRFFAGEVVRQSGETLPSLRPGVQIEMTREPVGVVGLITPWNFPLAIPAWKIAPALAYGNCVVFKPAELVPASAWELAAILHRAGLPAGVFNLTMGRGSVVGETLANSPGVDAISFTGSVETGRAVARRAIDGMKKIQLEMGGKNPFVVLDDADLAVAVECAAQGAFGSTGQRCTASSRLVVTDGIHDRFVDALLVRMRSFKIGHALRDDTDIGPVVDAAQLKTDLDYIEVGRAEGAKLALGGERLNRDTNGYFLSPALFVDTGNAMRVNREEIFGPVASVIRIRNFEEALAVANDTPFGLCAGIATSSLKHATWFKNQAEVGVVTVNAPTAGLDFHVAFGGRKGSSYGPREQGRYAREFYTTVKTAYTATP